MPTFVFVILVSLRRALPILAFPGHVQFVSWLLQGRSLSVYRLECLSQTWAVHERYAKNILMIFFSIHYVRKSKHET